MPTVRRNRTEFRRDRTRHFRDAYMMAQEYSTQGAAFRDKEDEAQRWLAAASPNIANFPFINAETGVTAATSTEVAQFFRQQGINRRSRWADLEKIRATLMKEAEAATNLIMQQQAYAKAKSGLIAWTQANAPLVLERVINLLGD